MLPLLNAIFASFTADSGLTSAFPGGFFRDQAPEGTAMPYLVSKVVSSTTGLAYSTASRRVTQIKFSAFGVGHDATGTLIDALTTAFDSTTLTLSEGTNDSAVRLGDAVPTLLSHDAQGNDVWEWSVVYEYGVVS